MKEFCGWATYVANNPSTVFSLLLVVFTAALVVVGALQWSAIRQSLETSVLCGKFVDYLGGS